MSTKPVIAQGTTIYNIQGAIVELCIVLQTRQIIIKLIFCFSHSLSCSFVFSKSNDLTSYCLVQCFQPLLHTLIFCGWLPLAHSYPCILHSHYIILARSCFKYSVAATCTFYYSALHSYIIVLVGVCTLQ